jgi:replicative DNA helicase
VSDLPPVDEHAERAALGCVVLAGTPALHRLIDQGVEPGHFYAPAHAAIFTAMVTLDAAARGIDAITVCDELKRSGHEGRRVEDGYVHALASDCVLVHLPDYARTIVELADLRRIRAGAQRILEGVELRDQDKIADGEALIGKRLKAENRTSTPNELADEVARALAAGDPETFPWPWQRLDKLTMGGMRRGQLTLIAGWSSHGKSVSSTRRSSRPRPPASTSTCSSTR